MEILFTPWRMEFILGNKPPTCIFCDKAQHPENDRAEHVLLRGAHNFVTLNRYPYTSGHLLVVPYRHVPTTESLTPDELAELMQLVNQSIGLLRRVMHPHGFNLGMNLGKAGGAGVEAHAHMHVVPRWEGDANFMPVVAQSRIIPQWIDETYDRLAQALAAGDAS